MMNKEIILKSRILIVDDKEANVMLLERILQQAGYKHYESLTDARHVIERFRYFQPDLILLDLMMPNVDGYAVMNQLRGWIPDGDYMPVLVITADTTRAAKQKALTLGAKDFLTKPLDNAEVSVRVYNLLETRWLHREVQAQNKVLAQQNDQLEKVVHARTRDLSQAQQRLSMLDKAKSDFLQVISHELRTPLNGLLGTGELILKSMQSDPASDELREMFTHSRERIVSMLENALLLTQISVEGEKFGTAPTSCSEALTRAIDGASGVALARQVRLEAPREDRGYLFEGSPLLGKALQAVLETAVKLAPPRDAVTISFAEGDDNVSILVQTHSGQLTDAAIAGFFDLLAISEASMSGSDLGLGPALAHRIITLFGGSLSVGNCHLDGIELRVSFRRAFPCSIANEQAAVSAISQ